MTLLYFSISMNVLLQYCTMVNVKMTQLHYYCCGSI